MEDTGEELARAVEAVHAIADECERRAAASEMVLGPSYFVEDGRRSAYRVAAKRLRRTTRDLPKGCSERARRVLMRRLFELGERCDQEAMAAGLCFEEHEMVLSGRGRAEALRTVARGIAVLGDRVPQRMAS